MASSFDCQGRPGSSHFSAHPDVPRFSDGSGNLHKGPAKAAAAQRCAKPNLDGSPPGLGFARGSHQEEAVRPTREMH